MQTVVETPMFTRQADKLFDEEQKRQLITLLAEDPRAGVLIPGTGGVRKLRYAAAGWSTRCWFIPRRRRRTCLRKTNEQSGRSPRNSGVRGKSSNEHVRR